MARPQKKGLDYFPFDVRFFDDRKIKELRGKFGPDGITLYIYLLCLIYGENGYYLKLDDGFNYVASADLQMGSEKIGQVINFLCERSLFNDKLFVSDKVLTSPGIQTRYQEAVKTRATKTEIEVGEYWLLSDRETKSYIKCTKFSGSSEKNKGSSEKNEGFSIEKLHKEKESKVKEKKTCKRGADKSAAAPEQVVISLIQNDGNMYGVTERQIARWTELYPAVDIMQELRSMCGWLEANPTRRKTSRGIPRFINTWLSKEQDKGGGKKYNNNSAAAPPKKVNAYGETEDEFFERLKNEGADLSGFDQGNTV